jgi:hypothetical protein
VVLKTCIEPLIKVSPTIEELKKVLGGSLNWKLLL